MTDRSISAVLARLRFGDSDGDDHDIAADEIERLATDAANERDEMISWRAIAETRHVENDRLRSQLTDFHNLDDVGEIRRLKALLVEAIEDIESWAGYASEYFQDKHDLKGCVARYRAAVDVGGKP